jgi:hypothetical protein
MPVMDGIKAAAVLSCDARVDHEELVGDLRVGQPARQQGDDLLLTLGQRVAIPFTRRGRAAAHGVEDRRHDRGGEHGLPRGDIADPPGELVGGEPSV